MQALVVVPTYCEAENIETVLTTIHEAVPAVHVLVVDDSSPDGTADLAKKMGEELGGIFVLSRSSKMGLGSAYVSGFAWAMDRGYGAVVEMDADLSHDPRSLPSILAPLDTGVDLVIGSRYVAGGQIPAWTVFRRKLSRWGNRYSAAMLGLGVADLTSGYRAYSTECLRRVDLAAIKAGGYGFQIEMVLKVSEAGGIVSEVPISFVDRQLGKSKMSSRTVFEALALVTWWGIRRPFRHRPPMTLPAEKVGTGAEA